MSPTPAKKPRVKETRFKQTKGLQLLPPFLVPRTECRICGVSLKPNSRALAQHAKLPATKPRFKVGDHAIWVNHYTDGTTSHQEVTISGVFFSKTHKVTYTIKWDTGKIIHGEAFFLKRQRIGENALEAYRPGFEKEVHIPEQEPPKLHRREM